MPARDHGTVRRATPQSRRSGVVAVLSWVVAVVVTGAIAGRAVAVLDASSARSGLLTQAEVVGALATARAAASAAPAATPTPTPVGAGPSADPSASAPPTAAPPVAPLEHPAARPTTPPPPAAQVVRTWTVTGGTVAASCRGATISLLYATPQDGWTVDVGSAGPDQVKVELKMSGQETKVTAVCVGGVPQDTVTGPTSEGSPDGGAADD